MLGIGHNRPLSAVGRPLWELQFGPRGREAFNQEKDEPTVGNSLHRHTCSDVFAERMYSRPNVRRGAGQCHSIAAHGDRCQGGGADRHSGGCTHRAAHGNGCQGGNAHQPARCCANRASYRSTRGGNEDLRQSKGCMPGVSRAIR